jgi:hypothetical protein
VAKEQTYGKNKNILGLRQKPCLHPSTLRSTEEGFAENGWAATEKGKQELRPAVKKLYQLRPAL